MQEMQKFTLGTAVLAGGKSSRMGQNTVLMEDVYKRQDRNDPSYH